MRNTILGIDPSEVHSTPVHLTGTRAVDLNDPTKEYTYVKAAGTIALNGLAYLSSMGSAAAPVVTVTAVGSGTAATVLGVVEQTAVTANQFFWLLTRGLWSGASGLTSGLPYEHRTVTGALQSSTTQAWGIARSTTSLEILGWGSPGSASFLAGCNPDHVSSQPVVAPGTRSVDGSDSSREYIYLEVPASTAVAVGDFETCNATYQWTATTHGRFVAVTAVSSQTYKQYAWFQVRGPNADLSNNGVNTVDGAGAAVTDGFIADSTTSGGLALQF